MDREITNIFYKGKFYNPAWTHYGKQTNISCDKCKRNNLTVCIGWEAFDLCMDCVSSLDNLLNKPVPTSKPENPQMPSRMVQSIYQHSRTPDEPIVKMTQRMFTTNMSQSIYRPSSKTQNKPDDVTFMGQSFYQKGSDISMIDRIFDLSTRAGNIGDQAATYMMASSFNDPTKLRGGNGRSIDSKF